MERYHRSQQSGGRSLFVRNIGTYNEVMEVVRGNSTFSATRGKGNDLVHFVFTLKSNEVERNYNNPNKDRYRERITDWLEQKGFADRHTEILVVRGNEGKITRVDIIVINWGERKSEVSISSPLGSALTDLHGVHLRH